MKKFFAATMAAFFLSRAPAQPAPVQSGIMAILDSFYTNWSAEIGWVQKFIDYPPPRTAFQRRNIGSHCSASELWSRPKREAAPGDAAFHLASDTLQAHRTSSKKMSQPAKGWIDK
tara:strand:- start:1831 stop:2178 length:348 start_codon:yes stop_codon:yes gene_type:complete